MRKKIVFLPYDFDTAIGINNEGALVFSYNLEDVDHLQSGADIYNGQQSVLWVNMRNAFAEELKSMYQTLRSTGALSYQKVEQMFEEHQEKWGEAVFNEDAWFKYLAPLVEDGSGAYLAMLQGSKAEQRKWWLYNRFRYIDSKYNAGDALSDVIQLRGYAKANVTVTPYADIYATVKYGSYLVQTRAARNQAYTLICPLDNVNDTEIYIYSASQLASVGDLSGLKVGYADFSMGTKLQSIKIGDSDSNYSNGNLTELYLGNNVLLRTLDVRNCPNLGQGDMKSVDISGCKNIEYVYFDGTTVTGVELPNGGILKVLHLPGTITNLTIRNQLSIADLTIPSYANISTLWLENVSSAVDEKAILRAIPASSRVRLTGIYWECEDAEEIEALFDILDTMRGLDAYGGNEDTAQVSGTIHTSSLTGAEIAEFNTRFPYIEVVADHTTSYRTYADQDGTVIKTVTYIDGVPQEAAPTGLTKPNSPDGHYSYSFVGWSKSMNATTADLDALDNVLEDRTVYAAFSETVRKYTVTWKNADGTTLRTDSNVAWGTTPSWGQAMPTNSSGQTAKGWSPTPSAITGNTTYTATYIPTYTVYFYNGSTLLEQHTVQQGASATYTGSTPVYTGTGDPDDYEFSGWSPSPTNIQANTSCYAQFSFTGVVNTISDDLATLMSKCDAGNVSGYSIGDTKKFSMGTMGDMSIQLVAKNADPLAAGGENANTTWLMYYALPTNRYMNYSLEGSSGAYTEGTGTIGGWDKSAMKQYILNTVVPNLPAEIRNNVKTVTKYTRIYNTAGSVVNNKQTSETFWLASRREMFGTVSEAETQGPIYSEAFPDNASRVKCKVGESYGTVWWLRSASDTSKFRAVSADGSGEGVISGNPRSVVLGFCI